MLSKSSAYYGTCIAQTYNNAFYLRGDFNIMDNILKIAQENSLKATKQKEDYQNDVFELIDGIILKASEHSGVTGIFLAQVTNQSSRIFQAMYRETNSPVNNEYKYTHGCDPWLICIDDNYLTIEDIAHHYAKLGFLTGIKVFEYKNYLQYRCLISWSDEENTEDKVNISKYVDGVDIFADDSHPEAY